MPYLFPLASCTVHTFVWEDGERDTCYRCKAEKPKEKDRDGHSPKSTVTASTEIHSEKESIMTQFTPGTRVTVADDSDNLSTATVVNSSGFFRGALRVTVHFDGKGIAVQPVHISRLAPLPAEEELPGYPEQEISKEELRAELVRRGASSKTTITELGFWCDELDADPLALFAAYISLGFMTNGANNE